MYPLKGRGVTVNKIKVEQDGDGEGLTLLYRAGNREHRLELTAEEDGLVLGEGSAENVTNAKTATGVADALIRFANAVRDSEKWNESNPEGHAQAGSDAKPVDAASESELEAQLRARRDLAGDPPQTDAPKGPKDVSPRASEQV